MRQQQRGGTFLGLVIGVVIGLGAALAVAIYVTKVPVPFLNKNQPRKAEQDAAEALKNKNWDPNAALYGKNPARPAPAAEGSAVPALPPASAATPPASAPVPLAAASAARPARSAGSAPVAAAAPVGAASAPRSDARPAASADPLGDLARARAAGATAEPFSYFVQAGAFRTPEDAEAQRVKLSLLGVDARVTEREQSGRTVYRVRLGPFDTKDAADRAKERMDSSGMESALVRVQR